jgi:hypothetical protein
MKLEGVEYRVNWDAFTPGTSIFLPCLNCTEVRKQVAKIIRKLGLRTVDKISIEDGVRGLRIWRT